jgi:hypothetical protein
MMEEHSFALCLTHDVDRIYQTYQPLYYGIRDLDVDRLRDLWSRDDPYWQFDEIMQLEEELGVRSSFYFLNEQRLFGDRPLRELLSPESWKLYAGRYDIGSEDLREVIHELDAGGWEIGLHGSYDSYDDVGRLRAEKENLEEILGHDVVGGRQHYLNLDRTKTWEIHRQIGLKYDATLGSSETYGFEHGHDVLQPLNDEFIVFPLTVMERTLMKSTTSLQEAKQKVEGLLEEARRNDAVMTALWHPRFFHTDEFDGYEELYVHLVTTAEQMGAWIGSCKEYYELNF